MSTTLTRSGKGKVTLNELARLRDTLIEEQQRMARVLTRIEKVLGDVDGPERTGTD